MWKNNLLMNSMKMKLLGALVGLARTSEEKELLESSASTMIRGLMMIYDPSASVTIEDIEVMIQKIHAEKLLMAPDCAACQCPCGRTEDYDMDEVLHASESLRDAKLELFRLLGELAIRSNKTEDERGCRNAIQIINDALFQIGCTYEAVQLEPWLKKVRELLHRPPVA